MPSARCWPFCGSREQVSRPAGARHWALWLVHSARRVVAQCGAGSQVVPAARRAGPGSGASIWHRSRDGSRGRILLEDVRKALEPAPRLRQRQPSRCPGDTEQRPWHGSRMTSGGAGYRPRGRSCWKMCTEPLSPGAVNDTTGPGRALKRSVRPLPRAWCRACRPWPRSPSPPR